MSGTSLVTAIVEILVSGITAFGEGVGSALSSLVNAIFISGTGESATISMFGVLILCFAAVSLAMGICRLVVSWVTSLGGSHM